MRTNREGNLKRFFSIHKTARVLELCEENVLSECDSISFDNKQEYDYIFWNPVRVLSHVNKVSIQNLFQLLSQEGKLIVFFDNPSSVHAFAQGDLSGENIGYPFLLTQLSELSNESHVHVKWYYPYPCVDFPSVFFSAERMPGKGECDDNFYHFDRARMEAFDEQEVTDLLVQRGMYPYVAHAYMIVISKIECPDEPIYTRFSNERRVDAQIRTDLFRDYVKKSAVTKEAYPHVRKMCDMEKQLQAVLGDLKVLGKSCQVNEIKQVQEGSVTFSYVQGKSLEQTLDEMLARGEVQEVADVLLLVCEAFRKLSALKPFEITPEFEKVFGSCEHWKEQSWKALPVTDVDLVCQNILLSEKAVVIDYEWTFDFPIPIDFMIFRFLYFYLEAKHRTCIEQKVFSDLYEKVGISEKSRELFLAMETNFQHYVQQDACVLCNSYDMQGKPVLTAERIRSHLDALDARDAVLKKPSGKKEQIRAKYSKDGNFVYRLPEVAENSVLELNSLDATGEGAPSRILRIGAMADQNGEHVGLSVETNGVHLGGLLYLFENCLPMLTIKAVTAEDMQAEISVEEIEMSKDAVRELKTSVSDLRFVVENREQQIRDLKNSASWKVTKPLRMLKGNKEE